MTSSYSEKITKLKNALENVFVKKTDIQNNLTSTDTNKPLSANQGKVLDTNKVDKISGKSLSTNDFTNTYKTKLDNLDTLLESKASNTHTHGNLQNDGSVGTSNNINKNVITDGNGKITTEAKPTIPSASSTVPSADTTNGAYGSGTTYARANHQHPKSSLYAEASHTHTKSQITDFPSIPSKTSDLTNDSGFLTSHQDISGKENTSNKVKSTSGWSSTTTDDHYPSEKLVKSSLDNKVDKENGKGLFSGSYGDLSNKPSYTATVTSSTTGAYKMGSINISGSSVDIYGKDTHQSLTDYIQKTSTDTGYLKSNGSIASLPTASTSQSGVVQLSNSTNSSSETLGATAKAVKTVMDNIPTHLEDLTLDIGTVQTDTGLDVISYEDTTDTLYWGRGALSHDLATDEVYYNDSEIATKGDIPVITGKENSANKVSSWSATTNNTRYPSEKLVKDSLDTKLETSDLLDLIYPVGSIYMEKDTASHSVCPIQTTLGGTWTRIENRFLYASENGQGVGSTGGSADAVVVEHNHTQKAHTHIQNQHRHQQGHRSVYNASGQAVASIGYNAGTSGGVTYYTSYTTPTNQNTTAENNATGVDGTGKNMPPYIIVNVWERTA